ncbi:Asparagine synthase [Actinomadura madurae]|uniref:Asparagine synthase n=1 Tax=Actinomadura madurae TaxID=1993 RepID=A0A1I5FGH3_9ACTN|nr:asparagine synthase-related protein [Actinomadura madurae]SFO22401.1 Asparagine synthase [Actinomadura madurae]
MRACLVVSARDPDERITPAVLATARRAIDEAVPAPAGRWRPAEWISPDRGTALLAWSNEPSGAPFPEPILTSGDRALTYCGYLGGKGDADLLLSMDALGDDLDGLGGCFSVFRAGPDGFEAATSITRACPVYHAEAGGLRFAASRALLAHLAARAAATGLARPAPAYDVMALQAMVRHGFFVSDETPFEGVRAVPNAATLVARRGHDPRTVARPLPAQEPAPRGRREARARVKPLAEALLAAVEPFRRHDRPTRLALSGGRDSRLIAAACHAAGVPFFGATHGLAGSPDVVLAQRVAEVLGVECRVTVDRQKSGAVVVRHPLRRAHALVRMCEGMNSAYENVNRWAPYDPEPRTSGSGGERLRGGFLTDQADLSRDGVLRRLDTIFLAQSEFLTEDANAYARRRHDQWAARYEHDGLDVLDKLHMFYKTGRWLAGSHTATLMNWAYYHPFLDNRVVREALALPVEWRLSEEPVALVLGMLAPRLRDVPLAGKRWRFEEQGPRSLRERPGWRRRATPPSTAAAGFNWRKSYGPELADVFREHILDGPPELFSILDRGAVERRLAEVPPRRPGQSWHLLSLSVLLSNAWREPEPDDLPDMEIPLPTP